MNQFNVALGKSDNETLRFGKYGGGEWKLFDCHWNWKWWRTALGWLSGLSHQMQPPRAGSQGLEHSMCLLRKVTLISCLPFLVYKIGVIKSVVSVHCCHRGFLLLLFFKNCQNPGFLKSDKWIYTVVILLEILRNSLNVYMCVTCTQAENIWFTSCTRVQWWK